MAKVAITESYLEDIADAIRSKTGLSTTYRPSEMANAILTISGGGGIVPTGTISITENGTYNVTNYASASVSVSTGSTINNQNKTVTPTTAQQTITADSGYTGLGTVTVGAMPAMTLPTSASSSATSGFTSKATISRSTSDQYINIPTGYNSAGAYYKVSAVPNGSATAPGTISGTGATVSHNSTTITLSKTVSVTPSVSAGYVSSGTVGNSSVSLSATDANFVASNIKKNVSIFGLTGTYEASGGGASNIIEGTFKYSTTTAAAQSITLNYSGSGYPIACFIVLDEDDGVLNSTYTNTVARYSIAQYFMTKTHMDETPTYTTSGNANMGAVATVYKSSNSTAATLTRTSSASVNTYSSSNSSGSTTTCVRFKSKTSLSVYSGANSGTSRYGFFSGLTYRYWIIYSS